MSTVSRGLPERPHLDIPKHEARELLERFRGHQPEAIERVRKSHPKFREAVSSGTPFKLADAQLVIAREYGFANWAALKQRIEHHGPAAELLQAIRQGDVAEVTRILHAHPALLHLPLRSGNWGPPMSHAANLGLLEIIEACHALGARDHQHAFERAVLQGQIETARWLHARGAKPTAGALLGCCETLDAAGFAFLLQIGAPLANDKGDRLAPLADVLGTYGRRPKGKHAILDLLEQHGYVLPKTPIMALHRGDVAQLEAHLQRDPQLLQRRFTLREIYPAECGCPADPLFGAHWTPIDGTTLLHLAVDFREHAILDWLLSQGADPNARAALDAEGFGGHTPLFNAVVNGPWRDDHTIPALLKAGASRDLRASLRKFLDWRETPRWHVARDVTPVEWARTFPDNSWVDLAALAWAEAP